VFIGLYVEVLRRHYIADEMQKSGANKQLFSATYDLLFVQALACVAVCICVAYQTFTACLLLYLP
jgi:hypothetical protein